MLTCSLYAVLCPKLSFQTTFKSEALDLGDEQCCRGPVADGRRAARVHCRRPRALVAKAAVHSERGCAPPARVAAAAHAAPPRAFRAGRTQRPPRLHAASGGAGDSAARVVSGLASVHFAAETRGNAGGGSRAAESRVRASACEQGVAARASQAPGLAQAHECNGQRFVQPRVCKLEAQRKASEYTTTVASRARLYAVRAGAACVATRDCRDKSEARGTAASAAVRRPASAKQSPRGPEASRTGPSGSEAVARTTLPGPSAAVSRGVGGVRRASEARRLRCQVESPQQVHSGVRPLERRCPPPKAGRAGAACVLSAAAATDSPASVCRVDSRSAGDATPETRAAGAHAYSFASWGALLLLVSSGCADSTTHLPALLSSVVSASARRTSVSPTSARSFGASRGATPRFSRHERVAQRSGGTATRSGQSRSSGGQRRWHSAQRRAGSSTVGGRRGGRSSS
ncbi:hypothetical protein PybrP1_002581 [[Pythium] brassicae (nom. inval.)]|nr:hypothetical protein PybrP1_002581 [[Pythium] brassicae (nom. inval.)]